MQSFKPTRLYNLRADANALGGLLREPVGKIIPTLSPVSLPSAGGFALARTEEFTFEEIVSCSAAYTRVSSEEQASDGTTSILVTSVVENLNILEVFSATRIVAQLTITIPRDGPPIGVSTIGSVYEGVRLAGYPCTLKLNQGLRQPQPTSGGRSRSLAWADVFEAGRTQAQALLNVFEGRSSNEADAYEWAQKRHGWMTAESKSSGGALCSLIDGLETTAPVRCSGHIVEVPHFGRIILGELYVSPDSAHLVGVRAELGCAIGGAITAACGGGGGLGDN